MSVFDCFETENRSIQEVVYIVGLQWHAAGRALYVARSGIETAERLMTMLMLRDALPLSAQLPCACPTPRNRRWDTLALQERTRIPYRRNFQAV